jgi:DnaJ-class molecular chaperone
MAAMNEKDYYAILGVEKTATTQEIRKAFQQKARQLHPDVNKAPDAEERFKEVSEAYAVLSDDEKRRRYDAMRSGVPFAGTSTSYGGTQGSYGGYGGYGSADPFGWGFPFGAYGSYRRQTSSARRPRSYNPTAGADIVYQLQLDEKEASAGVRRGVTYQRYVSCDACHGTGSVHSEHPETCPTCKGRGRISVDLATFFLVLWIWCVLSARAQDRLSQIPAQPVAVPDVFLRQAKLWSTFLLAVMMGIPCASLVEAMRVPMVKHRAILFVTSVFPLNSFRLQRRFRIV